LKPGGVAGNSGSSHDIINQSSGSHMSGGNTIINPGVSTSGSGLQVSQHGVISIVGATIPSSGNSNTIQANGDGQTKVDETIL